MQSSLGKGRRAAFGVACAMTLAAVVAAKNGVDLGLDNPPSANPASGIQANKTPTNFMLVRVAQGSDPLENPSGVITNFGLLSDGTHTEPDENTYLELNYSPVGPTAGYDYGRHFRIQGHENGGGLAYMTRINLDITDPAHRITLLSPLVGNAASTGFSSIDGSTYNPFTGTLLFTQEAGSSGGVLEMALDWASTTAPA